MERTDGGGGDRGVPLTTVALFLTWRVDLMALEKPVEGLKDREKIAVAMMVVVGVDVGANACCGEGLVH